ncbi:MAG: hypothetical protein HY010_05050 [Acidobacteria bacterium]|nr:hypothetical protein [Acidobacteriota bacterium]
METTRKLALLAAGLAIVAMPALAQSTSAGTPKRATTAPHKQKPVSHVAKKHRRALGEAASLERNEAGINEERDMREDNRGRLVSASSAKLHPSQVSKATYHPHKTASQPRSAQLKTGELKSSRAAHLETKETALHHQIHSDREQDRKLTQPEPAQGDASQSKNTNTIHLKKHNARMF